MVFKIVFTWLYSSCCHSKRLAMQFLLLASLLTLCYRIRFTASNCKYWEHLPLRQNWSWTRQLWLSIDLNTYVPEWEPLSKTTGNCGPMNSMSSFFLERTHGFRLNMKKHKMFYTCPMTCSRAAPLLPNHCLANSPGKVEMVQVLGLLSPR